MYNKLLALRNNVKIKYVDGIIGRANLSKQFAKDEQNKLNSNNQHYN